MPLVELIESIERFCAEPVRLSGEEIARDLVELARARNLLDLKFSEMAAAFARTDQYDRDGCISPIHWIRLNCHMTAGAAADRVIAGQQAGHLASSVAAAQAGEIGFSHLALIAREADASSELESPRPFNEARLLNKARDYTVGRFRNFCHHERHANDPDGYADQHAESAQARSLTLNTGDGGMLWIRGVLDPEGGAVLRAALDPLARRNGKADDRRMDRRLGDAIVELAHHAMDNGTLPRNGGQRPHLQATTTLETLLQRCGAPAGELAFSLPISARAVERIACDCNVTRILLNADSQVIDVGRSTRRISLQVRRALNARDGGCRWPGCDRPAAWTSAHHLDHWAKGGPTDVQNLVLLCHRHHWMVHEGRWQLIRTDGGGYLTVPPTLASFGQQARAPDVGAVA
jgi:Domain of unknown function (DUF222)/HNH endonuclease